MSTTWINRGHLYSPHVRPVLVDCNFVVDSTNGNGLGIRSLKGQGITNVFMHTSATPGLGPNGLLNPNPASGYILVQFADNFNRIYPGYSSFVSPVSGTPLTSTTSGLAYTIVSLGTTTLAQWQTAGLPPGITPAVGASFIAKATGAIGGTGAVEVPAAAGSGIDHIETVGDPNTTIGPIPMGGSPNVGGFIVLACENANALTAPANGTVIGLTFYLNQSNVLVAGE